MSEIFSRILANHSAPAICGIKASNLISISLDQINDLYEEIDEFNSKFSPKVCIKILQSKKSRLLILIYRQKSLQTCLQNKDRKSFLFNLGYPVTENLDTQLNYLKYRLNTEPNFPHEIGIFLGYDISDIIAYMQGQNCIYSGYWKVYSNLDEKKKLFNSYSKCRDCVIRYLDSGFQIDEFMM